jgi:hypothetical protein
VAALDGADELGGGAGRGGRARWRPGEGGAGRGGRPWWHPWTGRQRLRPAAKARVEEARAEVEEARAGIKQGRVLAADVCRGGARRPTSSRLAEAASQGGRRPPVEEAASRGSATEGTCGEESAADLFLAVADLFLAAAVDSFLAAAVDSFRAGGGEEQAGEGGNERGSQRPLCLGRRRVDAGVIFGRLQPGRVEKLNLSFSLGQG